MDTRLGGMTVWITGASGGIGRACAEAFAAEGCNLVLHAGRRGTELEAWVAGRPWSDRAWCHAADVRDPEALERAAAAGRGRFGRLDVVVVNAGVWPSEDQPLHEMSVERVRDVIDVNLLGALWTARAFVRGLAEGGPRDDHRGASVCLIGSTAGRFGEAGHIEYATSKAALYGILRSLKNEIVHLDPYGRVNMVEPGWTATPMAQASIEEPGAIEDALRTMPVRQLARAEDIAAAVLYLSAPGLARHTSGEVVTVAGGMEGRTQWLREQIDAAAVRARLDEK